MSHDKTILVLNGPNLNMLGKREPDIYGTATYDQIVQLCTDTAKAGGFVADIRQSNHEGQLIDWIQEGFNNGVAGVVINAAAYTHTSVAIHDALRLLKCPVAEVHLSNPKERESFRHISYVEQVAFTHVSGMGAHSYEVAIERLMLRLTHSK